MYNLKKYKQAFRALTFLLVACCASCNKFVEVKNPINQVVTEAVFDNEATAKASVLGIYSKIMEQNDIFGNGAISVYTALSSDEVMGNTPDPARDQFTENALLPNNSIIEASFWQSAYSLLYQTNACIAALKGGSIPASTRQQLLGEAKFVRALYYFYLANLFGDVPLEITTDYKVNASLARTPRAEVISQVIEDLRDAQQLLTPTYASAGHTRPNKWTATALLARVYLYQSNWAGADSAASAVISSGGYRLHGDVDSVFLAVSQEAIFQFVPIQPYFHTSEGNTFIPQFSFLSPNYQIQPGLLAAFDTTDQRLKKWTTVASGYTIPFKYKEGLDFDNKPQSQYSTVLRLAEQYLIRAEANAELDRLDDAKADLNLIRTRAGLANTTASNKQGILAAILQERRFEFFTEWGHRWLDLKRTQQAAAVLQPLKSGWNTTDTLYPIPYSEIQLNPFLQQNPGYQ